MTRPLPLLPRRGGRLAVADREQPQEEPARKLVRPKLPKPRAIPVLKRSEMAAASSGYSSGGSASPIPSTAGVTESDGPAPELLDDPLIDEAEVKKMKEYFSHLFKYSNQLVARSKEKSKQLMSTATISVEEHARVVKELNEKNAAEIRKLQETKNKALKEQRDAHDKLEKKLKDSDHQMVDSMKRIKSLSAEL